MCKEGRWKFWGWSYKKTEWLISSIKVSPPFNLFNCDFTAQSIMGPLMIADEINDGTNWRHRTNQKNIFEYIFCFSLYINQYSKWILLRKAVKNWLRYIICFHVIILNTCAYGCCSMVNEKNDILSYILPNIAFIFIDKETRALSYPYKCPCGITGNGPFIGLYAELLPFFVWDM